MMAATARIAAAFLESSLSVHMKSFKWLKPLGPAVPLLGLVVRKEPQVQSQMDALEY